MSRTSLKLKGRKKGDRAVARRVLVERIAWLGMEVVVPGEWGIARYSILGERGSLVVVDRRRQRLMLSWVECEVEPLWEQVVKDYESLDLETDEGAKSARFEDLHGWRGHHAEVEGMGLTRAGRWDGARGRWIEMIVGQYEIGEWEEVEEVLAGFAFQEDEGEQRWRAFGLDVSVGTGWRITGVKSNGLASAFRFTKERRELRVSREKRLEVKAEGDVKRQMVESAGVAGVEIEEVMVCGGHRGFRAKSGEKQSRWSKLMGRRRVRTDEGWLCGKKGDTYYQVSMLEPAAESTEMGKVVVRCCDGEVT